MSSAKWRLFRLGLNVLNSIYRTYQYQVNPRGPFTDMDLFHIYVVTTALTQHSPLFHLEKFHIGNIMVVQYIPRNMHTVLLFFALLWLCNRS